MKHIFEGLYLAFGGLELPPPSTFFTTFLPGGNSPLLGVFIAHCPNTFYRRQKQLLHSIQAFIHFAACTIRVIVDKPKQLIKRTKIRFGQKRVLIVVPAVYQMVILLL